MKVPNAFGVTETRIFSDGVEQHHYDTLAFDHRLHHQATASSGDVAGLLQADIPFGIIGKTIGVAITDGTSADRQRKLAAYRVLANHIVLVSSFDEAHQIAGARPILRRQPGGVSKVRVVHPEQSGLRIHRFDESRYTTRIRPAQQLGCAILR